MKINWLPSSIQDLVDIQKYYVEYASAEVAENILNSVYSTADFLIKNPEVGRVSNVNEDCRKFGVFNYNYLIYYRVKSGEIEILSVFDTRQNPKKVLHK